MKRNLTNLTIFCENDIIALMVLIIKRILTLVEDVALSTVLRLWGFIEEIIIAYKALRNIIKIVTVVLIVIWRYSDYISKRPCGDRYISDGGALIRYMCYISERFL